MNEGSRLADVKIGLFVVVALVLLIVGTLWIAGSTVVGPRRVSYRVLMQDSGGLGPGDRVRIAGVSVGRIQSVVLRPDDAWPVLFEVAVRASVPLRTDAGARITTSGLLGSSFLQLDPGSPSAAPLPAGGEIRGDRIGGLDETLARLDELSGKAVGVMDQVGGLLEQVSTGLDPILARLEKLVSEENAESFRQLLSTLNGTVQESAPRISVMLERLDGMSAELERGVENLPGLSDELSALVEDLRAALGPDGSRLAGVLEAAQGSLGSADQTLAVLAGNRTEIEVTVRDLQQTVANLKSFSQQLKERPFSMVRKVHAPDRRPGDGASRPSP